MFTAHSILIFSFVLISSYLVGSLCSAIIVSRLFSLPDPRSTGSLNPGATNVLRLSGKKYALLVLLGDGLNGTLAVILTKLIGGGVSLQGLACLAVVLGHLYPIFFRYKGGKGVATAIGALFGLNFILGIMTIVTWLFVAHFSRYASLASITAICLAPFYSFATIKKIEIFPPLLFIALFVLYKHKSNLTRLLEGDEPKLKSKHNSLNKEIEATLKHERSPSTNHPPKKRPNKISTP